MKILIQVYYLFRSVFLRGLINSIKLLNAEKLYEKKFAIKTSAFKKSDSKEYFHYQGASYRVLLRIFSELMKETKNFDFVDIGCGKGRAVFVAEHVGYTNLCGIELDEELVKDAKENIKLYPFKRKESSIDIIHANALEYDYKNKRTVYFLFNPFNESIMEKVLDRISSLSTSETWFVYMNPLYPEPFKRKNVEQVKKFKTRFYTEALVFKMNRKPDSH